MISIDQQDINYNIIIYVDFVRQDLVLKDIFSFVIYKFIYLFFYEKEKDIEGIFLKNIDDRQKLKCEDIFK